MLIRLLAFQVIIGICAMHRKANSKPMRSIMTRMCEYYKEFIEFIVFPEEVILNEPVENWCCLGKLCT
jgi:inositol hexakisphosphate/diphosphoinositol-pentakisphosphate kinase